MLLLCGIHNGLLSVSIVLKFSRAQSYTPLKINLAKIQRDAQSVHWCFHLLPIARLVTGFCLRLQFVLFVHSFIHSFINSRSHPEIICFLFRYKGSFFFFFFFLIFPLVCGPKRKFSSLTQLLIPFCPESSLVICLS